MCKAEMLSLVLAGFFSILTALCFPFLTLLFGHVFKEFINYNLAVKIKNSNNQSMDEFYCNLSDNEDIAKYLTSRKSHQLLHLNIASLTFFNLAVTLGFFVVAALSRSFSAVAASQMGKRLRHKYFSSLIRRNVGWFESNWIPEMPFTLLLDGIQIIEIGITCSIVLIQRSVTIIACLVIGFLVNWQLTLVVGCLLPFLIMCIYVLVKAISFIAAKEQDALMLASSIAEESLLFIETVKLFEGQQKEALRYLNQIERANKESRKILMLTVLMVGLLYFFILTFFTLGSWFGFHLMLQCQCEPSDIILVTAEMVVCSFSISELLPAVGEVIAGVQSATLIEHVMKERTKINSVADDGMSLNVFEGGIEFSGVAFSYPSSPNENILNGVTFKVRPGQTMALVGCSGCGKSTILKLITKLYDIDEGMIRFDNVDGKYLDVKWLRSQIGVVSQEATLFNATIAENIRYGKEGSTMEEIIQASKKANAHSFITDLTYGYTSLIGTEGISLTPELEVLIGIARALIRDPTILLIDNTGYEFDRQAEEVVLAGIDKAREGRTTIIIPHRLSTIQNADVIVCIDNGKIMEYGTHATLIEENGLYKSLLMNQVYRDEFSSIEMEPTVDDLDSNRLIDELEKCNDNLAYQMDDASEKSPLLLRSEPQSTASNWMTFFSIYKEVLSLVFNKSHWVLLVFAMTFFVLAGAILSSFFIIFEKMVEVSSETHFNSTSAKEISHAAEIYSPLYSILGVVMMVVNFIGYTVLSVCEENLNIGIRQNTFKGLLNQNLKWFSNAKNSVDALSNMLSTDTSKISQVLSIRVGSIAWSVTAVLGALSASFALCWPIGLTLLPSYVWLLIAGYLHCKFTKRYTDYRNQILKDGTKMAAEALSRIFTVIHFGMEDLFIRKYDESLREPFRCDLKHAAILGIIYGLSQMLIFLFIGFGYLIGTFLILSSSFKFTYSDILTALFTIWFASLVFKGRFDIMPGLEDGAISSRRILKYLTKHSSMNKGHQKDKKIPSEVKYSLQLKNVWSNSRTNGNAFTSSPLLSVDSGQTLALVGPEFAHSNTVLSLVEKIDSPTPNTFLLDGIDICELHPTWLQRRIGIVSRYPVLFNTSVLDNIRYGVNFKYVSNEDVIDTAKRAGVHNVLCSLPQGYYTTVGFNGCNLSMEEKLSVAIARAMIRDPKILFMDDPPPLLEYSVARALQKARKGRTTVVIANRLSTMQSAHSIAVLHKGKVLEQGTHYELMEKKGAYFIMLDILEQF